MKPGNIGFILAKALSLLAAASLSSAVHAALTINELDADDAGTDDAEFVELYDGGSGNTSLNGYVLVFFNGSGDSSYAAYDLDGYSTDANGYFVLGSAGVTNVDYTFNANAIQNGADAVALFQASASDYPNGTAAPGSGTLIDAIVHDTNDDDDSGLLTALNQSTQYNEDENSNKDTVSLQRCANGTGTFTLYEPTPGAFNTCGGLFPPPAASSEANPVPALPALMTIALGALLGLAGLRRLNG